MRNQHNFELSAVPVKLGLANGGLLEKNGDIYIVHDDTGASFIIRKIGDKKLNMCEARTSHGFTAFAHTRIQWHTDFSYVDIDRDSNSVKIERINHKHDPKTLEDLFRKHLKW